MIGVFSAKGGPASRSGSETLQGRMTGGDSTVFILITIRSLVKKI